MTAEKKRRWCVGVCFFMCVTLFPVLIFIERSSPNETRPSSSPRSGNRVGLPMYRVYKNSSITHTNATTDTSITKMMTTTVTGATVTTANLKEKCFKQVYTWLTTGDKFHENLIFGGRAGEFPCPGLRCGVRVSYGTNFSNLSASDIIFLFYKSSWDWNTLMKYRKSHQKWVFWTSESPRHTNTRVIPPPQYADVYDYVMTYRTGVPDEGAALLGTYGEYHNGIPSVGANESKNWAENKSKMVAWVVTNCSPSTLSWKRTEFVHALSRLVGVDIYGPCGSLKCGDVITCGLQKYKFYLALENSECRDYITEKFWRNSLALGPVPIVFGAPKEDYLKVAPPNSFIFVQDFRSLTDLADYLKELDRNDDMYNKYFEWRKHGSVTHHVQFTNFEHEYLCSNVVKPVLEDEAREATTGHSRTKPILPNLTEWWAKSCLPDHSDFPITVNADLLKEH